MEGTMDFNYKRKDLIKLIKAKNNKDYKYLFKQAMGMLGACYSKFNKHKIYDYDEGLADFIDCSITNECDDLLKKKKVKKSN